MLRAVPSGDSSVRARTAATARGVRHGGPPRAWHTLIKTISGEADGHVLAIESAAIHHRRGLLSFGTIRVGSAVVELLDRIHADLEQVKLAQFERAPSAEAFIYRRLFQALLDQPRVGFLAADSGRWRRASNTRYDAQLQAFRELCEPEQAEALELRFARMLEPVEVAYVLGRTPEEVERVLEQGVAFAEAHFGPTPPSCSKDVGGAIQEAFSLQVSTKDDPHEVEELPAGTIIGDRYEIERSIGEGAFARVYRARDRLVPNHVVALKLVSQELIGKDGPESSLRELHHIASVFHPSVVQLKDYGWHEGWLWFVMPFYRGETLAERIARGPMSRDEAKHVFTQLALALAALHDAGVRHQDIKPENILLAQLGSTADGGEASGTLPVLIDLGVSARAAENFLAGTPEYFAPEVALLFDDADAEADVGDAADVYSLALCLREALEPRDHERLEGRAVKDFVARRAREPARVPSRRDLRDLSSWFGRWLAHDPAKRPTARELARELDALARPARRRRRRRAILRWLVPLTLLVVTVVASLGYTLHEEATRQGLAARDAARIAELEQERADQAARRAARMAESLELGEEERRTMATQMEALSERYRAGTLSRQELAERLARAESEGEQAAERVRVLRVWNRRLRQRARDLAGANQAARAEVTRVRGQLRQARRAARSNAGMGEQPSVPPSPY